MFCLRFLGRCETFFFSDLFDQNGLQSTGQDVASVPNTRQAVDVRNGLGHRDTLVRVQSARCGDAFGDEEGSVQDEIKRFERLSSLPEIKLLECFSLPQPESYGAQRHSCTLGY